MNVLQSIREFVNSPQNAAQPSGSAQIVVQPQSESAANIANEVNSGAFGPPSANSPMDRVVVLPKRAPDQLAGVPFPSSEQSRAFDEDLASEGYRAPKAAIKGLAELDAPYLRLQDAISKVTRSSARAWQEFAADIAARTAQGDETADGAEAWSREDFEEDFRVRLSAYKAELHKIAARAWVIAEPVLQSKAEFARNRADALEETARLPFDRYHVAYSTPLYVLLLRKYAVTLADGSRRNAGLPSSMLQNL